MKFRGGTELMNLPEFIKFGMEIEVQNVDTEKLQKLIENAEIDLQGWRITTDASLTDNGAEVVSPPLSETRNPTVYEQLGTVLELIKQCPKNPERPPYVNSQCGGHIHFDATVLESNPEMMENFLRLWAESEELIYKMCNAENDPIREGAMYYSPIEDIKGLVKAVLGDVSGAYKSAEKENKSILSKIPRLLKTATKRVIKGYSTALLKSVDKLNGKDGFASPVSGMLKTSELKTDNYIKSVQQHSNFNKFYFNSSVKGITTHSSGINMQHVSADNGVLDSLNRLGKTKDLNTYEFRMHNGSLDADVWKQNILFDSAIARVVCDMVQDPEKVRKNLSKFYEKDVSEEEKVDRFLELLFESKEEREIYKKRWESVKDAPIFKKVKKGKFSETFKRDDLKKVSLKTKAKNVVTTMKRVLGQVKEFLQITDAKELLQINDGKDIMEFGGRE